MSYLMLDPTCNGLMKQLREMDRQRDHLRAQLADAAMHVELAEVDRNLPWYSSAEFRAHMKTVNEEAIRERIAVRARRRAEEMRLFGAYVRPGTWDADLDEYQEPKYEEDVGDGYKIRLVRARDLTWNGYVILPEGHCAIDKHYDFFSQEAPADLPRPPLYLTYGDGGVYGFYLTNTVKPREDYAEYRKHDFFSVEATGATYLDDGSTYMSYGKMRKLCVELVEYFKGLAADHKTAAICRDAQYCREHHCYYVGKCVGCSPPPPAAAAIQYYTSTRAPQPKKSWAAVAAGK